jgi:hypothetical protein
MRVSGEDKKGKKKRETHNVVQVGTTPTHVFFLNSSSFMSARSSLGHPLLTLALASTILTFKI